MAIKRLSGFFVGMIFITGLLSASLLALPIKLLISPAYGEEVVLATVNNEPIYQSDLDALITEFKRKSGKSEVSADEKKQLVENLTIRRLILQQPEAQSLKNEVNINKKVKEFEESLIVSHLVREHVNAGAKLTEDELRQYYTDNKDRFSVSQKLQVRVILLKTREDADDILSKLKQGEDFAVLATEYSMDLPTAKKGGSLGVIERGKVLPQIWRAIFDLKENEVSDIVETDFGFNIFLVEKIVEPESIKPFEEVKAEIERALLPQKREDVYDEMVKNLRRGARIEIFEERFLKASNPSS